GDLFAAIGASQSLPEVEVRGVVRGEEALFALLLGGVAAAGQLDAGPFGEDLQRLHRRQAVDLFEEGENVPRFGTAEALVAPGVQVDVERWCLLAVEWTAPRQPSTRLLQDDPVLLDDLRDVDVLFHGVEVPGHQAKYRARLEPEL